MQTVILQHCLILRLHLQTLSQLLTMQIKGWALHGQLQLVLPQDIMCIGVQEHPVLRQPK